MGEHSFHLFFFGLHSPCVKKMMANNERFMAREVRPETLCYLDSEKEEELLELKLILSLISICRLYVNSVDDLSDYTSTGKACSVLGFLCLSMSVVTWRMYCHYIRVNYFFLFFLFRHIIIPYK